MTTLEPVDISRQIFAIAEALAATPELISAYLQHHSQPLTVTGIPGVDYAWSKPSIAALEGAGEVFVAQYDSLDETKNLTPARAHDLLAAGIKIVLVYEYNAQDMLRGKAGGEQDAQHAETAAQACGIDGIPIYFACDWNATPGQQGAIDAYLDGCANVIGLQRVGLYGGYWPLSRARAAGKATYYWGTPAWSGTEWATSGFKPDIMQGGMVTIGGVQCDLDAAHGTDFGQWPRPTAPSGPPYAHYFDGSTTLAQAAAGRGMSLPRWLAEQAALARPNDLAVGLFAELGAFRPRAGIRYWSQNP